jgi:hypothetical protein
MYQLNPGNLPLNVRASHLYISKLKVSTCILNCHVGVLGSLLAGGQCGHAEAILFPFIYTEREATTQTINWYYLYIVIRSLIVSVNYTREVNTLNLCECLMTNFRLI